MTSRRAGLGAVGALALAAGIPAHVRADGVSCDARLRATSEQTAAAGAALERSGKLVEAYAHYRAAGEYCDVATARDGLHRVGKALGDAAEKAGRAVGDDRLGSWESKSHCLGKATPECVDSAELEALRRASAIAWYEGTGNGADADRVMLAHAKAHPEDLIAFGKAWSHFMGRDRRELQQLAAARAAKALAAEERAFASGPASGLRAEQCIGHLKQAQRWFSAGQLGADVVDARAVQRGDACLRGTALEELGEAKQFYEFAGRADKEAQLRARASAEGEKALAANQRMRAAQYFAIAEDEARAKAAIGPVAPIEKPDPEKMKKMQKTDAEKEKFRKEQADLEKELGM